jgi:hypothetical protein
VLGALSRAGNKHCRRGERCTESDAHHQREKRGKAPKRPHPRLTQVSPFPERTKPPPRP